MKKLCILALSSLLSIQPLFAAMTDGGGDGSSGSYSSKKDKKNKEFDPFESIYGLIRLEKFAEAHESLKSITVRTPSKQADKYNLLGFTARKRGDLSAAAAYYTNALKINPKHLQALEYQGELYLQLGEIEEAKKQS
jgi:tetratricopeptide (TPR) repeat protein